MHKIDGYTKECIKREDETANFIDKFFYETNAFKGTYKRTKTSSIEDYSGIDIYETVDGVTKSIDEKAYTSRRGEDHDTFALEGEQTTVDLNLNITYQRPGWFLQNIHFDKNGCKKNDYYNLLWINKLKDGKSDIELKNLPKRREQGLPCRPAYTITGDDYKEVEGVLFSVENLFHRFGEIGVPIERLEEGCQKCFDAFLAMCKRNPDLKYCSFTFGEIFGTELKEGYEGKLHGKRIYFTVSKIPIYDKGEVIGYSIPVNIIVPKKFYLSIPGCEHRIITRWKNSANVFFNHQTQRFFSLENKLSKNFNLQLIFDIICRNNAYNIIVSLTRMTVYHAFLEVSTLF